MTAPDLRSPATMMGEEEPAAEPVPPVGGSAEAAAWTRLGARPRGRVMFFVGSGWVVLVVLLAVLADLLPLARYDVAVPGLRPRTGPHLGWPEPLGTDVFGRSMTSRLVHGARQSLTIGVASTALALSVGLAIGVLAGYFRGAFDAVAAVLVDAVLAMPGLLLLLAIAAVGRRDTTSIVVGLAVLGLPTFARLSRACTLSLVDRSYVVAARALGASHRRIILRELLPSVVLRVSTYTPYYMALVIVVQASLSFLGLGTPPPRPTWGGTINEARPYLENQPYLLFVPSACIVLTVMGLTVIGERLRGRWEAPTSEAR